MTRTTFLRMGLALLMAGALALAGCGGDDNGVDQSVHDMALAGQAAAQEEAAEERAAREAAEAAAAAAEAALEEAEEPDEYQPSDPGGTLDGQEGRAAAQRIDDAAHTNAERQAQIDAGLTPDPAGVMSGASGSAKHGRLGYDPEVTVDVMGGSELKTPDHAAMMDAPMIAGFDGSALEKDGPGLITQYALVYTDIQPSVRAWGDVYRYNTDVTGADIPLATLPSEAARTHLRVQAIAAIADGGTPVEFSDSKVSLTHGLDTTTGVTTRTIGTDTVDGTVRGRYDGVAGRYVFTGVTVLSWDGETLTISGGTAAGTLLFRADDPDEVIPDRDYLTFGIWANIPDAPTTANPGMVRPFADGNATKFSITNVHALAGGATYSGGAVGHYATRDKGSHLVDEGRFTAKASLTANFDAANAVFTGVDLNDDSPNVIVELAHGMPTGKVLTGKITDFMSEDGMEMPGWVVNLKDGMMTPDVEAALALTPGMTRPRMWPHAWQPLSAKPPSSAPPTAPPAAKPLRAAGMPTCTATIPRTTRPA